MKAVLLVSHGSRSPKTVEEVAALAVLLRQRLPEIMVEFAFLEITPPSIPEGIDLCVSKGAIRIVVALNFLNAGRHANHDIPAIVAEAKEKYPHIQFAITKPVGQHGRIPDLFVDLIHEV